MQAVNLAEEPDIRAAATAAADLLIKLEADIAHDGQFGLRTLEVTSDTVRVLETGGAVSFTIPIAEIKSARNEPLVGGGRLEVVTVTGEIIPIISYSLTLAHKFSEAARGIEQLAKKEQLLINLKEERLRCVKCLRLLPEKDGVCPACVNRGKTMLRISKFLTAYRKQAITLALLSVFTTILNLAPPKIQGMLIDQVLTPKKDIGLLWTLAAVWFGVLVVSALLLVWHGRIVAFLAGSITADLRSAVYRAIEFLRLTFFDKKQVGAITSRVTNDTDRVWGFLVDGLPYLATNGLLVIGIIIFLFTVNPLLACAILAPIPLVGMVSMWFWRPMSQMFHKVGQKWARFHMHLNESLTGIRVVKAFANEDHEFKKFTKRNNELRDSGVHADAKWYTLFGLMSFFTSLGTLINWTVGGWMVYTGKLTFGDFWMVNAYLVLIYGPLQWFAQINSWFSRAMAGADRIFEIIDSDQESYQVEKEHFPITGEVQFDNVRFGYDKSNPVLKGLNFTAAPGEMIGLVGKSGAGKSTTINLICRFYEPDAGAIRIDGKDYREISLQDMRRQIGIVLQEPFLFNGTISENIAYGKPGATFEEIVVAAKAANAHNFVLAKPDGYDSMVGEKGAKLSGGEKQRVSIARAILHNPRILILDEATSSVDVETEKQIQEAIGRLIAGRTTFAIAHRLSTLRNASRLVVLDKGEIAEIGTHAELMEKKGVFYTLVQTQSAINEIIGVGAA
jgi:ATP-binding cassette, subfamily B, bacterial